jgi:hypothetical protein
MLELKHVVISDIPIIEIFEKEKKLNLYLQLFFTMGGKVGKNVSLNMVTI